MCLNSDKILYRQRVCAFFLYAGPQRYPSRAASCMFSLRGSQEANVDIEPQDLKYWLSTFEIYNPSSVESRRFQD